MSIFTSTKKRYAEVTPRQFILSGVFMLVFAAAIGAGFAARSATTAAVLRDCDNNAIMKCGSANKDEFIDKAASNNNGTQGDLKTIYSHFGLSSSQYADFEKYAQYGTFYRNGSIVVNSKTVATNGYSMGRHNFGGSSTYKIGSKTYYYGTPSQRWASGTNSLPVMVWFDDNGAVKMVVMSPCGNPSPKFSKKSPSYSCNALNKHIVDGKKNTYRFSADASNNSLVNVVKFNYYYNDGSGYKLFDTTTSESEKTNEITFTKSSTVKVEVVVKLLSGKYKTATSELCKKNIGVVKEEFLYVCDALIATARDNTNRRFRFTVITKQSNNVSVDSADFTLDGQVTTKDVTDEDQNGNFFKDYDFNDAKTHKVSVIVNFTADGKHVTSKKGDCVARVTPEEEPVCEHNPKLPPNHPKCKPPVEECIPEGKEDENCELPSTGPAGVASLVAGVTAAGAVGHRLYTSRRARS